MLKPLSKTTSTLIDMETRLKAGCGRTVRLGQHSRSRLVISGVGCTEATVESVEEELLAVAAVSPPPNREKTLGAATESVHLSVHGPS